MFYLELGATLSECVHGFERERERKRERERERRRETETKSGEFLSMPKIGFSGL